MFLKTALFNSKLYIKINIRISGHNRIHSLETLPRFNLFILPISLHPVEAKQIRASKLYAIRQHDDIFNVLKNLSLMKKGKCQCYDG